MNPKIKHRLWVTMRCQCRFINSNESPIVVWDTDDGGGCAWVESRLFGNSLYLLLNLSVILKLLLKKTKPSF